MARAAAGSRQLSRRSDFAWQGFRVQHPTTDRPSARPVVELGSEDGTRRFQVLPRRSMPGRWTFRRVPPPLKARLHWSGLPFAKLESSNARPAIKFENEAGPRIL